MTQTYLLIYAGKLPYITDKPGLNSYALGKVYDGLLQVFRIDTDTIGNKVYRLTVIESVRSYGTPYWAENWIQVENKCLQ